MKKEILGHAREDPTVGYGPPLLCWARFVELGLGPKLDSNEIGLHLALIWVQNGPKMGWDWASIRPKFGLLGPIKETKINEETITRRIKERQE